MHRATRIIIALVVGVIAGTLCYGYSVAFDRGTGDIGMPICMGQAMLAGQDPYAICRGVHSDGVTPNQANPLTTALLTLPLIFVPPSLAAALFFGIISALLAYASTQHEKHGLLIFIAFPYWQAMQTVQWSPLLVAVGLLPGLLPLALAKPHVAIPLFITRLNLRRLYWCVAIIIGSLLIDPSWPLRLTGRIPTPSDYLPPLLTLPLGPILLLALWRWRTARARLLLLLAIAPQRLFYDQLLLWLIPRSRREFLLLGGLSWIGYFGWFFFPQGGITWVLLGIYLPALVLIWRDAVDCDASPRIALQAWWQRFLNYSRAD
jgi:hypothetical protein